jgi:hypothetical protein
MQLPPLRTIVSRLRLCILGTTAFFSNPPQRCPKAALVHRRLLDEGYAAVMS